MQVGGTPGGESERLRRAYPLSRGKIASVHDGILRFCVKLINAKMCHVSTKLCSSYVAARRQTTNSDD